MPATALKTDLPLPDRILDLGLNEGIWCPDACQDVMRHYTGREALRAYSSPDNDDLLDAIAESDRVDRDCILLGQGSGPLLSTGVRFFVETAIKRSPVRVAKWVLGRRPYGAVTGQFTYFKLMKHVVKGGLGLRRLPNGPESAFHLHLPDVKAMLKHRPGLVYVCNPNNPTGQLMLRRHEIVELLEAFPDSTVWVDEAYVQFMDPDAYEPMGDLAGRYDNLVVSRTFSFAYGLAAARVGYLLGPAEAVRTLRAKNTRYGLGALPEALAVAALRDTEHLPRLRAHVQASVAEIRQALDVPGVETFPTHTHFVFGRFTDGRRSGAWLHDALLARNIRIRQFEPVEGDRFDAYFRINVGTPEENALLCAHLAEVLA